MNQVRWLVLSQVFIAGIGLLVSFYLCQKGSRIELMPVKTELGRWYEEMKTGKDVVVLRERFDDLYALFLASDQAAAANLKSTKAGIVIVLMISAFNLVVGGIVFLKLKRETQACHPRNPAKRSVAKADSWQE